MLESKGSNLKSEQTKFLTAATRLVNLQCPKHLVLFMHKPGKPFTHLYLRSSLNKEETIVLPQDISKEK